LKFKRRHSVAAVQDLRVKLFVGFLQNVARPQRWHEPFRKLFAFGFHAVTDDAVGAEKRSLDALARLYGKTVRMFFSTRRENAKRDENADY
jgi:hypothetical protein